MVHEKQPEIGYKIYQSQYWGKNGAVKLGLLRYQLSQKEVSDRITLMSTLYSAFTSVYPSARRGNPLALVRGLTCMRHLSPLIAYATEASDGDLSVLSVDQCETVSRILLRWSTIPVVGTNHQLVAAHRYLVSGIARTMPYTPGSHTRPHLLLTMAELQVVRGNLAHALGLVEDAEELVNSVEDANHKSRLCRDIALLHGCTFGNRHIAEMYIDAAEAVADADPDVHRKNAEARRTLGL